MPNPVNHQWLIQPNTATWVIYIWSRQYRLLYMQVHNHSDMRHSGKKYTNDKSKIEAIKAKYKNGVPDEVIKEMVDLK